jgi:hypothetical protein
MPPAFQALAVRHPPPSDMLECLESCTQTLDGGELMEKTTLTEWSSMRLEI